MLVIYTASIDEKEDKTKFERIYEKYYRLMFWKASQILSDAKDVEDAVHSSFLKIIKALDQIDLENENKTKSFVLVVTEHTAIDMLRKNRKSSAVSLNDLEEWQIPPDPRAEREIVQLTEENRILAAVESMPRRYKEVFLLKYSVGYENHQIAKILGISEALVRKRISRGKEKLEKMLKERGIL